MLQFMCSQSGHNLATEQPPLFILDSGAWILNQASMHSRTIISLLSSSTDAKFTAELKVAVLSIQKVL